MGIDVSSHRAKAGLLQSVALSAVDQVGMLRNPDSRILLTARTSGTLLATMASSRYGLRTGDAARLIRKFWERPLDARWVYHQGAPDGTSAFTGRQHVLRWENGGGPLKELAELGIASIQGGDAWGRRGVVVSLMGALPAGVYTGEKFDNNCAAMWPHDDADLGILWSLVSRPEFATSVRELDRSIKVTNATLLKISIDRVQIAHTATNLPEPFSGNPSQWIFNGNPLGSTAPLHVAVARLLGYVWPEQQTDGLAGQADSDGIVCIPAVGGEGPAAERLRTMLSTAYGSEWRPARLNELLSEAGAKLGAAGLERWFRDGFFKDHCKIFANRPFIWQIWDGTAAGFSALLNYHRLDRRLLERLTHDYLGNWWISRLREEIKSKKPGAENLLVAAEGLKDKLQLILEGESEYDIYVRWKTLAEQPMGWDPDLDDGVRLNIRPFMTAGILRHKPNIKWDKDRGKNPDGSERFNNLHYTLAEKRSAREGIGR